MSFDFFDEGNNNQDRNLQDVVQQVVNQSFQFDQFDPVDKSKHSESFNSDFFGSQHKEPPKNMPEKIESAKSKQKNQSFEFQNSRNISEISYMDGQSFRYEVPPQNISQSAQNQNDRYSKLQQMLNQAKKNNLDMFYRNLDQQQNTYPNQDKFASKQEFLHFKKEFKDYKREREDNFIGQNGNYNFRMNRYDFAVKDSDNPFGESAGSKNFKKKQVFQSNPNDGGMFSGGGGSDNWGGNNLLPQEYEKDEGQFDFFDMGEEQIKKQVSKYEEKQYQKQAQIFFGQQKEVRPSQKRKTQKNLSQIQEERPNLFELTHEEQKMTKLVQNYKEMKHDYNDLMVNFHQAQNNQEKIMNELKNLKIQAENKKFNLKNQQKSKLQKKQYREREKQEKERRLIQIKEDLGKAKQQGKDILFLKINQKIQSLQNIVKSAITDMSHQKQQKFVPKIINYYHQEQPRNSRGKVQNSRSNLVLSRDQGMQEQPQQDLSRDRSNINQYFQEQLAPVQNMINQLKQEKKQSQVLGMGLYNLDQFSSPLQLDLSTQQFPMNMSRNRSQQLEAPFIPPENGKNYQANSLDPTNKYLRRCLTQKSSIIYQSFQFYITGKFMITNNSNSPILCQIRIANKCAINLYDIFVVVYGPQAQQGELQMRPAKIMYDQFKQGTSFLFQVDLSKVCIQNGGFSVMISYKTDMVNKKKVVFKVVLPFVQLIKPEFIYEEQFVSGWNHMGNEQYVQPQTLDFKNIRNHQDLKLLLPLTQITQPDSNSFSYGIMFKYPTTTTVFMMKIICYISGKASIHLKSSSNSSGDKKLCEQILDIMSYLCFG